MSARRRHRPRPRRCALRRCALCRGPGVIEFTTNVSREEYCGDCEQLVVFRPGDVLDFCEPCARACMAAAEEPGGIRIPHTTYQHARRAQK